MDVCEGNLHTKK